MTAPPSSVSEARLPALRPAYGRSEASARGPRVTPVVLGLALHAAAGVGYGAGGDASAQVFELLPSAQTGVTFKNQVIETPRRSLAFYDYFYNGSGVAVGDFDGDELPDLFFAGNDVPNVLYLNRGRLRFDDVSEAAGIRSKRWSTGVALVDINQDGLLDIYVCNSGPYAALDDTRNELYVNQGGGVFTEEAEAYGIADPSRSTQASFFDMDNDGDLDLWVMNHALRNHAASPEQWLAKAQELDAVEYARESNTLYRNEGDGSFTDVSEQAGIFRPGFGLGLAVSDFDGNGFADVYIANDYFIPDFLFLNNGDGTFTDRIHQKVSHTPYFSMGCDAADFNNDGLSDLVIVDMTPEDHVRSKTLMATMNTNQFRFLKAQGFTPQYMFNSLFINNGFGVMSDIGFLAGIARTDWSWAPLLMDLDNDGWKDLFVTTGYRRQTRDNDWRDGLRALRRAKGSAYSPEDYFAHLQTAAVIPIPNQAFRNLDGIRFENSTDAWGLSTPSFSNGAAYADLDRDGDLDLVVNNFDQEAFVYKNNSRERNGNNFVQFGLEAVESPTSVIGASIEIHLGNDELQMAEYIFSRGYQSFVEPLVHFGLGKEDTIERAVIRWPEGLETVLVSPAINRRHVISKEAVEKTPPVKEKLAPLFVRGRSGWIDIPFLHRENDFDDFAREILLPHKQSALGPALAVADVNMDGLEDFFVGGAKGQAGAVYLQERGGQFAFSASEALRRDLEFEDVGALFFDADGDADADLYVASGGGADLIEPNGRFQDRLYLNDGAGGFTTSPGLLPDITSSTQFVGAYDFDYDDDLDLFVGGRTSPGLYPAPPESHLLVNEGGRFVERTAVLAPDLARVGMVVDAEWLDVNGDERADLIIVGEWMPVTVFYNTVSGLVPATGEHGFSGTAGWWFSLTKADFDADGDEDLLAGNLGKNNKFHPTPDKPLHVFADDFDRNGSWDTVLSKHYKDLKVPVRGRECSTAQMPFVSEKFPTYTAFANASVEEIFGASQLEEALHYEVAMFESVLFVNDGAGRFSIQSLPVETQVAPVNGVVVEDFDDDGMLDLVLAGNMKRTEVETPSYDAGKGLFLLGKGGGTFSTSFRMGYSGLFLEGDVKSLELIHLAAEERPGFLVANNDGALDIYVWSGERKER